MKPLNHLLLGLAIALTTVGCSKEDLVHPYGPPVGLENASKSVAEYTHSFATQEFIGEVVDSTMGARIVCSWTLTDASDPMSTAYATISKALQEDVVDGLTLELSNLSAVKADHGTGLEGGNPVSVVVTYTIDISRTRLAYFLKEGSFQINQLRAETVSGNEISAVTNVEFYALD